MTERKKCEPGCLCGRHEHVVSVRHDKICEECGKAFVARRSDAKCCSGTCTQRRWERLNRDKIRETKRRYVAGHRAQERAAKQRYQEAHGAEVAERKRRQYAEVSADPVMAGERRTKAREYYLRNRDAILAQKRANPAQGNSHKRRSVHGGDWDEIFGAFWAAQDGRCYLCENPLDREGDRAIHLDHSHACCPLGRTCERCRRGLACKDCNRIIGIVREDTDRLLRMAAALKAANAIVAGRMLQPRQEREPPGNAMVCKHCGASFTAHRTDVMCCSTSCYYKMRYQNRKGGNAAPETEDVLF